MPTSQESHRRDLANCIVDVSKRAGELNEPYLQAILLVVAASIADRSDLELAMLCEDYARIRIYLMQNKKESPEGDSPF
jgi:hypothetical protein